MEEEDKEKELASLLPLPPPSPTLSCVKKEENNFTGFLPSNNKPEDLVEKKELGY